MKKIVKIEGMTCDKCRQHAQDALSKVPGVRSVTVDLEKGAAVVEGCCSVKDEDLQKALTDAGFKAGDVKEASCGCGCSL